MSKAISAADTWYQRLLGAVCVVLLSIMLVSIGGQVVMRYVFNSPLSWSEELARYSMIWLAMIAAALCARLGQHIALADFIPLSPKLRNIVNAVVTIVVVLVLAVLLYHSWDMTERAARQTMPGLGLSMAFAYASIPVGSFLMIVGLVLGWLREAHAVPPGSADSVAAMS